MSPSIRTHILLIGLIWSALLFATPPAANAGLITQAPTYVGLGNGLVGYWSFDGQGVAGLTAYDRSGQGNNGTLTNGPARTAGKVGQALEFDGGDDFVQILDAADPTAYTISAWVRPRTAAAASIFVRTDSSGPTLTWSHQLRINSSGIIQHYIYDGTQRALTGSTAVIPGTWYHVVATAVNSGDIHLFVNGTEEGTPIAIGSLWTGGDRYMIGSNSANSMGWFGGSIDDVRIYNRALSPDDIKRLYKIGGTFTTNATRRDSLTSGLVGHWSFDGKDMAGITAYDRSGAGNHGTTTGTSRAAGRIGQALKFDGADSYLEAPETSVFLPQNFSIAFWANAQPGGDPIKIMIGFLNNPGSSGNTYMYCNSGILRTWQSNTDSGSWIVDGGSCGQIGAWKQYIWIHDGTETRQYVDGVLATSATVTGTTLSTLRMHLGAWFPGTSNNYAGLIDEVRIYNRALSPDEIKRLYNMGAASYSNVSPKNTLTNGLVGYWTFDGQDMAGVTAFDRSGQGNNGTLTNSPVRTAGKIGQALSFDGADDKVQVVPSGSEPDSLNLGPTVNPNWTIAAWIYPRRFSHTNWPTIYSYNRWNGASLGLDGTESGVDGRIEHWRKNSQEIDSNSPTTLNAWNHVVITNERIGLNNNTVRFYLNGFSDGPSTTVMDGTSDAQGSSIGDVSASSNLARFDGLIDEVRVYNRALSPDEAKRLYLMGK